MTEPTTLKQFRQVAGIDQAALAMATNYSRARISQLEREGLPLPPELRRILAEAGADVAAIDRGQAMFRAARRAEALERMRRVATLSGQP